MKNLGIITFNAALVCFVGIVVIQVAEMTSSAIALITAAALGAIYTLITGSLKQRGTALSKLAQQIEASVNKDLRITENKYLKSPLLPLVKSLNHFGIGVNNIIGK